MANYIPLISDAVKRKDGDAFFAVAAITGHYIPFIKKVKNPIRADGYIGRTRYVEKGAYDAAFKQITGIFSDKQTVPATEPTIIEYSKNYTCEENDRLIFLAGKKIQFRSDGSLTNAGRQFDDIHAAIRYLGYIIGGNKKKLRATREPEKIQDIIKYSGIKKKILEHQVEVEKKIIKNANVLALLQAVVLSSDKTFLQYNVIAEQIDRVLNSLQSVRFNPYFDWVDKAGILLDAAKRNCLRKDFSLSRIMISAAMTILE